MTFFRKALLASQINPLAFSVPPVIWIDSENATGSNNAPVATVTNRATGTIYPQYRGCNLVGGGAQGNWTTWQSANPATRSPGLGPRTPNDYTFVTTTDIDYCISKGMNTFRLLVLHEAMQPEAYAAIPYAGALPNPTRYSDYYNTFKALVDYITITKNCVCIIDIHNASTKASPLEMVSYYDRQFSMTPSGSQENGAVLADFWGRLGTIFLGNDKVWFGVHNEPTISVAQWYPVAQAVIDAIRATGNNNKIVMPGYNYTGAWFWTTGGNHTSWLALSDPANNMIVQVHHYYDPDNSGSGQIAPNTTYNPDLIGGSPAPNDKIFEARFSALVTWARANRVKVFVGEVAMDTTYMGNNQSALMTASWTNTVNYINANADVIIGYTWWEYGNSGWAGNIFDLRQSGGVDNARMNIIKSSFVSQTGGQAPSSFPTNPATATKNTRLTFNSGLTDYWVWCPTPYDASHNTPFKLFVWLHGCGGQSFYDVVTTANALDRNNQNFIAMAPGGREGACWSSVGTDGPKILAAIADIRTRFNIDPRQIFLGGYSSGGDIGYPLLFQNAATFAGGLFCNTQPSTSALTDADSAAWLVNVISLAHLSDTTYPIATVRSRLNSLVAKGFPVTQLELSGTHYDYVSGDSDVDRGIPGTTVGDITNTLVPYLNTGLMAPSQGGAPATNVNVIPTLEPIRSTAQFKSGTKRSLNFTDDWFWWTATGHDQGATFWMVVKYTSSDTTSTTTGSCPLTLFSYDGAGGIINVGFSAGTARYSQNSGAGFLAHNSTVTTLNDGALHTVCWTHTTGGSLTCWVDGIKTDTFSRTYVSSMLVNIIGVGHADTDGFQGHLAEAMLWNGVITDQEIKNLHTRATQTWV